MNHYSQHPSFTPFDSLIWNGIILHSIQIKATSRRHHGILSSTHLLSFAFLLPPTSHPNHNRTLAYSTLTKQPWTTTCNIGCTPNASRMEASTTAIADLSNPHLHPDQTNPLPVAYIQHQQRHLSHKIPIRASPTPIKDQLIPMVIIPHTEPPHV